MNDVENKTMKNGKVNLNTWICWTRIRPLRSAFFVYVVYLPRGHFEASRAVYVRRVRSSVGYA
jgi:hypothetical protein